jgi:putative acetyltransferase
VAAALLTDAERRVADQRYAVAWLAVVAGTARARRFYERCGWADEGDLPYEVTAGGETFISPCRRYTRKVG